MSDSTDSSPQPTKSFFALDVADMTDEEIDKLAVALVAFQDEQVAKSRRHRSN